MSAMMMMAGMKGLSALFQYGSARQQHKNQQALSNFQNTIEAYNYHNTLFSINENRRNQTDSYLAQLNTIAGQSLQAQASLQSNAAFTGTSGNTVDMLQSVAKGFAGTASREVERAYNNELIQSSLNEAQAYLSHLGAYSIPPQRPSLMNFIMSEALSMGGSAAEQRWRDSRIERKE